MKIIEQLQCAVGRHNCDRSTDPFYVRDGKKNMLSELENTVNAEMLEVGYVSGTSVTGQWPCYTG